MMFIWDIFGPSWPTKKYNCIKAPSLKYCVMEFVAELNQIHSMPVND